MNLGQACPWLAGAASRLYSRHSITLKTEACAIACTPSPWLARDASHHPRDQSSAAVGTHPHLSRPMGPRVSRPKECCQSNQVACGCVCGRGGCRGSERTTNTDRCPPAFSLSCECVSAMGAIGAGLRQSDSQGACPHSMKIQFGFTQNEITTILAFRITHAPPCE